MQFSDHDLLQIDDEYLTSLEPHALLTVSRKILLDLKKSRERLNQTPDNSSVPPSSKPAYLGIPIDEESEEKQDVDESNGTNHGKPKPKKKKQKRISLQEAPPKRTSPLLPVISQASDVPLENNLVLLGMAGASKSPPIISMNTVLSVVRHVSNPCRMTLRLWHVLVFMFWISKLAIQLNPAYSLFARLTNMETPSVPVGI